MKQGGVLPWQTPAPRSGPWICLLPWGQQALVGAVAESRCRAGGKAASFAGLALRAPHGATAHRLGSGEAQAWRGQHACHILYPRHSLTPFPQPVFRKDHEAGGRLGTRWGKPLEGLGGRPLGWSPGEEEEVAGRTSVGRTLGLYVGWGPRGSWKECPLVPCPPSLLLAAISLCVCSWFPLSPLVSSSVVPLPSEDLCRLGPGTDECLAFHHLNIVTPTLSSPPSP